MKQNLLSNLSGLKNIKPFLMACILTMIMISCRQNYEEKWVRDTVQSIPDRADYEWMIIMPGLGCAGCIQVGENFMINFIDQEKIKYVLVNLESVKIFEQKTGIRIREKENVRIEYNDSFAVPSSNRIYPLIIRMENGRVKEYEFQSPDNDMAFARLSDLLRMASN